MFNYEQIKKFIAGRQHIYDIIKKRWEKTIKNYVFYNEDKLAKIGVLLNNQIHFNKWLSAKDPVENLVFFKKLTFLVITETFPDLIAHDLIYITPMFDSNDCVIYDSATAPKTVSLGENLQTQYFKTLSLQKTLDYEFLDFIAKDIKQEIDYDIIHDLIRYAEELTLNPCNIVATIQIMFSHRKESQKWIIANSKTTNIIIENSQYNFKLPYIIPNNYSIKLVGSINDIKIYESNVMKDNQILVGCKDNNDYGLGYHYCPYMFVMHDKTLAQRCAKVLTDSKSYKLFNLSI